MTLIVDYGRGNLFSLSAALGHLGIGHEVTSDPVKVRDARRLVVPGVGAFGDAIAALRSTGLFQELIAKAQLGVPLLGICVGMQILAARGEEFGVHEGLGLVTGVVRRLPEARPADPAADRIPNVGWRSPNWVAIPAGKDPAPGMVYFNHSYAIQQASPDEVAATVTFNGASIVAAVRKANIVGFQFHPERSGPTGLALLRWFFEEYPEA